MPLKYHPLSVQWLQIRVLSFDREASRKNNQLSFNIKTLSLDDKVPFVAFSYVWGDAAKTKTINVEGMAVEITLNLHDVLLWYSKHRRFSRFPAWADAICINQHDLQEKSAQIRLMSRIYEDASTTICWLGSSTARIREFLQWGHHISVDALRSDARTPVFHSPSASWIWLRLLACVSNSAEDQLALRHLRIANGEQELYCINYFRRMWTFQESLLSQKKAVFVLDGSVHLFDPQRLCGRVVSSRITNSALERVANRCGKSSLAKAALSELSTLSFEDQRLAGQRWLLCRDARIREMSSLRARNLKVLSKLVMTTSQRSCSDPRDRIFAVLGLHDSTGISPRKTRLLNIDYTKSVEQTFLDALRYIYETESAKIFIDVLSSFMPRTCAPQSRVSQTGHESLSHDCTIPRSADGKRLNEAIEPQRAYAPIPSWLPDFNRPDRRKYEEFDAITEIETPPWWDDDYLKWERRVIAQTGSYRDRLIFRGSLVGRLQSLIKFPLSEKGTIDTVLRLLQVPLWSWKPQYDSMLGRRAIQTSEDTLDRDDLEAFVSHIHPQKDAAEILAAACRRSTGPQVVCSDIEFWSQLGEAWSITNSDHEHAKSCPASKVRPERSSTTNHACCKADLKTTLLTRERVPENLKGQTIFVTEKGQLGFCTTMTLQGDLIIASSVLRRQVVLRQDARHREAEWSKECEAPGKDSRTCYEFIDWAYISYSANDNDVQTRFNPFNHGEEDYVMV